MNKKSNLEVTWPLVIEMQIAAARVVLLAFFAFDTLYQAWLAAAVVVFFFGLVLLYQIPPSLAGDEHLRLPVRTTHIRSSHLCLLYPISYDSLFSRNEHAVWTNVHLPELDLRFRNNGIITLALYRKLSVVVFFSRIQSGSPFETTHHSTGYEDWASWFSSEPQGDWFAIWWQNIYSLDTQRMVLKIRFQSLWPTLDYEYN